MYNYTGYGMNPYQQQLTQNRIAQMEQQYNYQQPYMQNQSQTQMLKGRPVSSYDEAKASMIDLDGSLFVFTDIAHGCIYTKQILLDGSAELKTYTLRPTPIPAYQTCSPYESAHMFSHFGTACNNACGC